MWTKFISILFTATIFVAAIHDRKKIESSIEYTYRFVVSFQASDDYGRFKHVCGGTVLSENYVLTSADCLENSSHPDRLIAGSTDLNSGGTLHMIAKKYVHNNYTKGHKDSNIAIAKVSPSFMFQPRIKSAPLETKELPHLVTVTFVGWGAIGSTRQGHKYPENLQQITLQTITNRHCNDYGLDVTDKQICTLTHIGQGLCARDEGSPLIEERMVKTVMGIATTKYSCGNGVPDVYTKVSPFINWINATCKCI